jgi:hypothetical protein
MKATLINGCKILKNGVKGPTGIYSPVWYWHGTLVDGIVCVTIYAKDILKHLPKELGRIENGTDITTDYFEEDTVRFVKGTPEYEMLLPFVRT